MGKETNIVEGIVISKIKLIRGQKVMLDSDLAELYEVETRVLNQQVKRNLKRFPEDFMFQLNKEEFDNLKSQNVTSSWGGRRKPPYAFTEHGVLMLSSVLKSEKAIAVNIRIVRVFTKMRDLLLQHKDLVLKMEQIELSVSSQGHEIKVLFEYMKQLMTEKEDRIEQESRKRIGYKTKKSK